MIPKASWEQPPAHTISVLSSPRLFFTNFSSSLERPSPWGRPEPKPGPLPEAWAGIASRARLGYCLGGVRFILILYLLLQIVRFSCFVLLFIFQFYVLFGFLTISCPETLLGSVKYKSHEWINKQISVLYSVKVFTTILCSFTCSCWKVPSYKGSQWWRCFYLSPCSKSCATGIDLIDPSADGKSASLIPLFIYFWRGLRPKSFALPLTD